MVYHKNEGKREEFAVISTAEKVLEKKEKEKKEQNARKAKVERFMEALYDFQKKKNLKRMKLVFDNGDEIILNLDMNIDKRAVIFFHEDDKEDDKNGNRELTIDKDLELLLAISKREVVNVKEVIDVRSV